MASVRCGTTVALVYPPETMRAINDCKLASSGSLRCFHDERCAFSIMFSIARRVVAELGKKAIGLRDVSFVRCRAQNTMRSSEYVDRKTGAQLEGLNSYGSFVPKARTGLYGANFVEVRSNLRTARLIIGK
jgi:hypothetical protein